MDLQQFLVGKMGSKRHDGQRHRMHSCQNKGRYHQTMTIMDLPGQGQGYLYRHSGRYLTYVPLPISHSTPPVSSLLCHRGQEHAEDYGGNERGSVLEILAKEESMGPADRRGGG